MPRRTELDPDAVAKAIEDLTEVNGPLPRRFQFRLSTMFAWTAVAGLICALWLAARMVPIEVYGVGFMVLLAGACAISAIRIK
jgi:hypothetical protein